MKIFMTVILVLALMTIVGCGKKEEASKPSGEPQKLASSPTTDLHTAVALNDLEAIRQHIAINSDLNALEPSRASTPLITAAALGKTDAARILIDAGAELDYQNGDGSTALHTAAFFCRLEIVEALLAKGADKSLRNNAGQTAYDIVNIPFEDVKGVYEALEVELKPGGIELDYDRIKAVRPIIAKILR